MLAAWQGLAEFEGRASLRTWLYRIATNRCLNARRSASRRPPKEWDVLGVVPPEPTRLGEVVWLEPFPDALLEGVIDVPLGPEARYEQTESISLAFVKALQVLPPRQLAVLILRDVLGFHANEVAGMLDSTVESVNSALKRARASLQRRRPPTADHEPPPAAVAPSEDAIMTKFVSAWESADLDALVALLTDDVFISMPPMPFEYEGRDLGSLRSYPHRRTDLRHDPLRKQRAPMVRATAIAPGLWTSTQPHGRRERRIAVHAAPLLRRAALRCDAQILGAGKTPVLHVKSENGAKVAYQNIGFRLRAAIGLTVISLR